MICVGHVPLLGRSGGSTAYLLTKYSLQNHRNEKHILSAELVRQISAQNATGRHTGQKEHFRHILHVLIVAHQIPFGGPRPAQTIRRIVLPGGAFEQLQAQLVCGIPNGIL